MQHTCLQCGHTYICHITCHCVCTDLIRQLYSDEHITAEEASHLESKKLFQAPTASPPTAANGASVIHTTPPSSGVVTQSPANAVINLIKDITGNYSSAASTGSAINTLTTTTTIATTTTTTIASQNTTAPLSQIPPLADQVSQVTPQPAITITPNTPLSLPQGLSHEAAGVLKLTTTTGLSSLQQSNLTVSGNTSRSTSSVASSENGDSNDGHYYDDMTSDPSSEPDVVPSQNGIVFEM